MVALVSLSETCQRGSLINIGHGKMSGNLQSASIPANSPSTMPTGPRSGWSHLPVAFVETAAPKKGNGGIPVRGLHFPIRLLVKWLRSS